MDLLTVIFTARTRYKDITHGEDINNSKKLVDRAQAARMEVLDEISRASAAVGLDYKNVLDALVQRTAELIGDACIIMLFSEDGQQVFPGAIYHRDRATQARLRKAFNRFQPYSTDNQYFRTLLSGSSVYIPVVNEVEFRIMFAPEIRPIIDARGISSFISVPLRVQKHVIGGLAICRDPHGALYTHDDHVLLQDLADRAALTIQNARLFDQVQEALQRLEALSGRMLVVQEEERRTIARELHDEIGQTLSGIMMQLGTAKGLLPKSAKSARSILDQVEALIQQTLEQSRMLIAGLRPPVLDDLGLGPAIRRLGSEFQEEVGTLVEIDTTGLPERLPASIEVALFRIIQEALTNVRKHAHARRVSITLAKENEIVLLSVQDDGVGFEKQITPSPSSGDLTLMGNWLIPAGHFGLIGIQERAAQLGGQLNLTSAPGQGTTLRVEIPLPETKAVFDENL
jgi:signal transduction histidine kinase